MSSNEDEDLFLEELRRRIEELRRKGNPSIGVSDIEEFYIRNRYQFIQSFHRLGLTRLINYDFDLDSLFYDNHEIKEGVNPKAAYYICFSQDQILSKEASVTQALEKIGRKYIVLNASNKTFRQLGEFIIDNKCPTQEAAYKAIENLLLYTDYVLVITELSKLKSKQKALVLRSLVKIIDDAHFDKIYPSADLVLIDYADFIQKSWNCVGTYLKLIPPNSW